MRGRFSRRRAADRHAPAPACDMPLEPLSYSRAIEPVAFAGPCAMTGAPAIAETGAAPLRHQGARRDRFLRRGPIDQRKRDRCAGRSADGAGDEGEAYRAHETRRRSEITPFRIEIGGETHRNLQDKPTLPPPSVRAPAEALNATSAAPVPLHHRKWVSEHRGRE